MPVHRGILWLAAPNSSPTNGFRNGFYDYLIAAGPHLPLRADTVLDWLTSRVDDSRFPMQYSCWICVLLPPPGVYSDNKLFQEKTLQWCWKDPKPRVFFIIFLVGYFLTPPISWYLNGNYSLVPSLQLPYRLRRSRAMHPPKHDPAKPHCFLTHYPLKPEVGDRSHCACARDQTRIGSDASSTEMQCLRPLRHSGGPECRGSLEHHCCNIQSTVPFKWHGSI
jgi:hypothetical protein